MADGTFLDAHQVIVHYDRPRVVHSGLSEPIARLFAMVPEILDCLKETGGQLAARHAGESPAALAQSTTHLAKVQALLDDAAILLARAQAVSDASHASLASDPLASDFWRMAE